MDDAVIQKMIDSFSSQAELEQYANAQYRTILELQRKLSEANQKVKELEEMLQSTVPSIAPVRSEMTLTDSNEEAICKMQLQKLHDVSLTRQLTLEETKRVEIYTKLLLSLKQKDKKKDTSLENLSTEELLKQISDEA